MNKFTQKLQKETAEAIKNFGEYNWKDKGPSEFININGLANKFSKLSPEEKKQVAQEVASDSNVSNLLHSVLEFSSENSLIKDDELRQVIFCGSASLKLGFNQDFLDNTERYKSWVKKE